MRYKQALMDFAPYARLTDGSLARGLRFGKQADGDFQRVTVENISGRHVRVREIVLFETGLPMGGVSAGTRFYGEGYQMLSQYAGTLQNPRLIGAYGTDWDFFKFPRTVYNQNVWTAYNMLCLWPDGEDVLLYAFTSCARYSGEFRFCGHRLEIVMNTEDLLLRRGDTWTLEEFGLFSAATRDDALTAMAARINHNHPPMKWHESPTGWCSYYCLRPMTADGLVDNARAMKARVPELTRIQIDGGYSAANGDWLTPNPKLGGDLKTICERIRAEGVKADGYMSPFIISKDSKVYNEHPEWLVQDATGRPYDRIRDGRWCMIDGSHPGARDYLRGAVRHMHDEWGWRYFKLDFIAYGAFPGGLRYDPDATMVSSFRDAMRAIVDEVGRDSFVLACNAPMWPVLGLCHGNRVTNDIFRDWKHIGGNAEELFWRNWQHERFWLNDPDVIVLEKQDLPNWRDGKMISRPSLMTDAEIEFHKAFGVACGGMILSGDLLPDISQANIDVLKKLINNCGKAAVFDDESFTVGRTEKENALILTVFNWEDAQREIVVNLDKRYEIRDFWTRESIGTHERAFTVTLRPHEGRAFTACSV